MMFNMEEKQIFASIDKEICGSDLDLKSRLVKHISG